MRRGQYKKDNGVNRWAHKLPTKYLKQITKCILGKTETKNRERETHYQPYNIILSFHSPSDVVSLSPCHHSSGFSYACHGCGDHIQSHGESHHSPLFLFMLSRCVHLASKQCYVSYMFTDHCLFENEAEISETGF